MPQHRIARLRLRNQRLAGAPPGAVPLRTPAEVVAWMGGVQAQEYPFARWSIGQRAGVELDHAAVDAALARGDIFRTHVLRDTWHFVAAPDARWLLRLTGPRIQARNGTMYRKLGLDGAELARGDALLADILGGGGQLTRRALADELAQRGVVADGLRMGYLLMHAELEEVICSGARQGRQHTYALFDERVPPAASSSRDQAPAASIGLRRATRAPRPGRRSHGRTSCRSTTNTSSPTGQAVTCSTSTGWPGCSLVARRCSSTP